jgi:hypothetical protein
MLMPLAAPVAAFEATSAVFINEIHYDNTGTDAGEAVEIVGPAGTDLTGWSIVLYNGATGAIYDTDPLPAVVLADQGGGYGTVVLDYPSNGIQNGSPDGIALVNGATLVPASAYSYVFDGQAQTLDHQFVTNSMLPELIMMRAAHINSDWPADHAGDGARGSSDHDPQVALHSLEPTTDRIADLVEMWAGQGGIKSSAVERLLLIQLDGIQSAVDQGRPGLARLLMRAWNLRVPGLDAGVDNRAGSQQSGG